jgi:hypothetical protein
VDNGAPTRSGFKVERRAFIPGEENGNYTQDE